MFTDHGFLTFFQVGDIVTWKKLVQETTNMPEQYGDGPFRIIGGTSCEWILQNLNTGETLHKGISSCYLQLEEEPVVEYYNQECKDLNFRVGDTQSCLLQSNVA